MQLLGADAAGRHPLDDHSRCYSVETLTEYLGDVSRCAEKRTHRKCRRGLLALLTAVRAIPLTSVWAPLFVPAAR